MSFRYSSFFSWSLLINSTSFIYDLLLIRLFFESVQPLMVIDNDTKLESEPGRDRKCKHFHKLALYLAHYKSDYKLLLLNMLRLCKRYRYYPYLVTPRAQGKLSL